MSWEMVRMAIRVVKSEAAVLKTTFAGLCSVFRAGLAVLETRDYDDGDVIQEGELEAYIRILKWFAARWTVGNEYLERVEKVVGRL
jgi:hypothetical protein